MWYTVACKRYVLPSTSGRSIGGLTIERPFLFGHALRKIQPNPIPQRYSDRVKHCSQCGKEDNPIVEMIPSEDGTEIVQRVSHSVRPEIQYLKAGENITPRQQRQGWTQRIFQARPAIERDVCINCINANYIRRQLNAEQRSKAKKLEESQGAEENFYLVLCDVDGAY